MTLDELYRLLRSTHVQAQGIVDTLQEPLVVLDRAFTVLNANPAFFQKFAVDRDATLGHCLFDLGNGQWDIIELRALLDDVLPKAHAVIGYEVTHDFPVIGRRTILVSARCIAHADGISTQMLVVFEDVSDRRAMDAGKDLLLAETHHRMKNLFAILRAVATQTGTEGRTAAQYRDVFLGRFEAVMTAQMLITTSNEDTELSALLEQALHPLAGARATITPGPSVVLSQHQVLPVSMMVHELATNAVKYGALSSTKGAIDVSWETQDRDGQRTVLLHWLEHGGPPVLAPSENGFGTRLIKASMAAEGGEAAFEFAPTGLRVHISLPLAH